MSALQDHTVGGSALDPSTVISEANITGNYDSEHYMRYYCSSNHCIWNSLRRWLGNLSGGCSELQSKAEAKLRRETKSI